MRVVSDSEILVIFVKPDGECTAKNISEWHKMVERRSVGKGSEGRNGKITTGVYVT